MNLQSLYSYFMLAIGYVFKLLPIKKNRICFNSFGGQYTDSPRKISEKLHEKLNNAEFIWEISDKCRELPPDYVKCVKPQSLLSVFYRSTSHIIVDNYMGWSYGYAERGSARYKILSHQKKKGQFNICTWHGTALKKIGLDQPENKGRNLSFYSTADLLTANCVYMRNLYNHMSEGKVPITMSGTPRNDILFNVDDSTKVQLKRKLKIPEEKKIILFAPTFRSGDLEMSGLYQLEKLDIDRLLSGLSRKFGGEWVFVFRAHDSVLLSMENQRHKYSSDILSGNIGDDMSEYLAVSDVLLTDYSSSFFDFLFTGNPCFLYCPDYDHYGQVERGFYFTASELPYPTVTDEDTLYKEIDNYDTDKRKEIIESFLKKIGNVEDGSSTEKIVKIITDKLDTK